MRNKFIAVITLCAIVAAPALLAAGAPTLVPIACVSPAEQVRVVANVDAAAASAKVYYKAAGQTAEYYSDMRRAADGSMWTFIPAPETTTKSFTYRVVSTDARGIQTSSALLTANTASSCVPQTLSADEFRAAWAMIIGLTRSDQSAVPTGFQCKGVVSYITVNAELRPNDECHCLLAGAQPAQPILAEESNRKAAIIILTGAGLIGVGGVVINNRPHKQVSPSRP